MYRRKVDLSPSPIFKGGRALSVDLRDPITAGIQAVGVGQSLIFPGSSIITGTAGYKAGRYGTGPLMDGVIGVSMGAFPAQTDTTNFTLALVAESPDLLANVGIGYRNGGGPGTSFCKLMPSDSAAAKPKLDFYSNTVARSISNGTYTGANVIVGIKRGLTLELWVNGVLETSNVFTTGQLSQNAATCYYGPDESVTHTAAICFGAFWPNRALSAAEISALYSRPFRFIRGIR